MCLLEEIHLSRREGALPRFYSTCVPGACHLCLHEEEEEEKEEERGERRKKIRSKGGRSKNRFIRKGKILIYGKKKKSEIYEK